LARKNKNTLDFIGLRKSQKEAPTPMTDFNNEYHSIDIVSEGSSNILPIFLVIPTNLKERNV